MSIKSSNLADISMLGETEQSLGKLYARPYFQLGIIIAMFVLLGFLAAKAGFSIWLSNKFSKENLLSSNGRLKLTYNPYKYVEHMAPGSKFVYNPYKYSGAPAGTY